MAKRRQPEWSTVYSTNRMEAAQESQLTAGPQRVPWGARRLRASLPVALPLAAGLVLRLWMLKKFFEVNGDSLIYGGLAKNLILYGRFALTLPSGEMYPTLIRLPGYPLFLAVCFRLFGMENYFAAACVQIALDLLGCVLLADMVRRIAPPEIARSSALVTLWLAALCPFTASYVADPMTETPTLFMLALAMWAMVRFRERPQWASALWFTFAVTGAALLRPDGALAAVAFAPALIIGLPLGNGPGRTSASPIGSHGPVGRAFAGAGSICCMDSSQLERISRVSAACAKAGDRSRRKPGSRMGALGKKLVSGFRLDLSDLLECAVGQA